MEREVKTQILVRNWCPKGQHIDGESLRQQFHELLKELGFSGVGNARPPYDKYVVTDKVNVRRDKTVLRWHRDGGAQPLLVLWASKNPTEVLLADGTRFPVGHRDVVMIANKVDKHRRPSGAKPRWLMQVIGDWIELEEE